MFDRFADDGREVIALATKEAQALNHEHVASEHLILGLTRARSAKTTVRLLASVEVDPDVLHARVLAVIGPTRPSTPGGSKLDFTPDAKATMRLAMDAAMTLFHGEKIGGHHLLIGVVRNEGCNAAAILRDLGVTSERISDWDLQTTQAQFLKAIADAQRRLDDALGTVDTTFDELDYVGHMEADWIEAGRALLRPLQEWAAQRRRFPHDR